MLAFVGADDLHAPATRFGIAAVHAEEIAGENRRFIAAGSGAHFDKTGALIVGIFRQQQNLQLLLQHVTLLTRFLQLFLRHVTHFRIVEHLLRGFDIFLHLLPVAEATGHIGQLSIFA